MWLGEELEQVVCLCDGFLLGLRGWLGLDFEEDEDDDDDEDEDDDDDEDEEDDDEDEEEVDDEDEDLSRRLCLLWLRDLSVDESSRRP